MGYFRVRCRGIRVGRVAQSSPFHLKGAGVARPDVLPALPSGEVEKSILVNPRGKIKIPVSGHGALPAFGRRLEATPERFWKKFLCSGLVMLRIRTFGSTRSRKKLERRKSPLFCFCGQHAHEEKCPPHVWGEILESA